MCIPSFSSHEGPNLRSESLKVWVFFRQILLLGAICVYSTIVMGGIVRSMDAASACPDWPTCMGMWKFPSEDLTAPVSLNVLHRLLTLVGAFPLTAAVFLCWRYYRRNSLIVKPLGSAVFLYIVQVIFGALLSTYLQEKIWYSAIHLAVSLGIQAMLVMAVVSAYVVTPTSLDRRIKLNSPYGRLSAISLGVILLLLISGVIVANTHSSGLCEGWPVCTPEEPLGWLTLLHRLLVGVAGLVISALFYQSWRTQRSQAPMLVSATAVFVLFWAQALLGAQMTVHRPAYLLVLHQATAGAVWVGLLVHLFLVGFSGRTVQDERLEASKFALRRGMWRDLLMLTKPIVVVLLLVTTFAGMVIGAQEWPPLGLAFWTMVGGFMAAGGCGAINQVIDQKDDEQMQRTQKRPIPSGRLTSGEGLAFGVALLAGSFYVMVAFVNLLAALLSLAGMVYYVLIYSILLKKKTVQNIVIGGGAGAIPPLVGWAAATGNLNIPSLFLFAIIFMWTPPHFWALALVRRNDYARAGVPMLPVIRGEKETRGQILVYTIELVILTLILPFFGLGGSIYLVGAAVLGLWLLGTAWYVWKQGGNKLAWKMYRYSSMYLAFLFTVMMVDALL